jgi:hypothetical protein
MLKLSVKRQPMSEHSYFAEKSFEATLRVGHLGENNRWLYLSFATNADGQRVSLSILRFILVTLPILRG